VIGGLVLAGLGGLDICVDRARDGQVGALGLVLVDDGRSLGTASGSISAKVMDTDWLPMLVA